MSGLPAMVLAILAVTLLAAASLAAPPTPATGFRGPSPAGAQGVKPQDARDLQGAETFFPSSYSYYYPYYRYKPYSYYYYSPYGYGYPYYAKNYWDSSYYYWW